MRSVLFFGPKGSREKGAGELVDRRVTSHGGIAERYGVVNRALPDAERNGFVAKLAGAIAGFDR